MSKAQVAHYYNVPEEKITVVHNGVDLNKFNPDEKQGLRKSIRKNLGIKNDETALLFAGNDFRRKGLQFAMQCAANLIKKGLKVKLLIAGRQKAGPYLRLVRKNGYADNFLFLGHVEKIESVFCASDMFVLPTFYDPFSNVCLEAMACGLPVMTTRLNGAAEIIEDRVSGILVDSPWDLEEMITAASSVIENNSSGLKEMSEKSVLAARQNPVEKNIQETEKVYMEVMKEKGVC
jgi:UDP-glucose:(heptosyl)LPS alpha-1,3-glucosyltransferase